MKKIFSILSIILLITSCDYVNFPDDIGSGNQNPTSDTIVKRKVLIEDFTGHRCPNCPDAASTANSLMNSNKEQVITVAIHAGTFANIAPSIGYYADFKTNTGITYNNLFGIQLYPRGMINRKNYDMNSFTHIFQHNNWPAEVLTEIAKPANASLKIINNYNSVNQTVNVTVETKFLHDTLTGGPYRLVALLIQDSIIAPQLHGSNKIDNYVHNHTLRDNINGIWGEVISNVPVTKNEIITKSYTYTLKNSYPTGVAGIHETTCDPQHCHIVAFLYNDATKEVIQVQEEKIMK